MSKWDGKFNGTYETSKYAERTLEEDDHVPNVGVKIISPFGESRT
jgi:hypothetical protein